MKKILVLFLTMFTLSFVFAATSGEDYLSHYEALVKEIETAANQNDVSGISYFEAQKKSIDDEGKSLKLTFLQRINEWRLSERYDTALSTLQAAAAKNKASSKVDDVKDSVKGKTDEVLGNTKEKADEIWGDTKEKAGKQLESAKDNLNEKLESIEKNAKDKLGDAIESKTKTASEKVKSASETASEKVKGAASKAADAINGILND